MYMDSWRIISGIKQAFYYVNKSDESGSILNDEQVKRLMIQHGSR